MGKRARGANAIMAAAYETAYGDPPTDDFFLMPFVSSDLGEEQQLISSDLLGTGREPLPPTLDVINNDGSPVVPVDVRYFGFWLKLFFGAPTTAPAIAPTGTIKFAANPLATSTVTINGTAFTFVAASPTGNQVLIGVSLAATMTALAVALNASVVAGVAEATYTGAAAQLNILHDTLGPGGNDFTLAASANSKGTVSGETLTGGANTHTFHSGAVDLPSMGIEIGMPEIPTYGMNYGVLGNTMKVSLARSGLLNATLGLIAQGEAEGPTSAAVDPTELAVERLPQFSGAVKRNGVALGNVVSAEWMYSNDLEKAENIREDGRIDGADAGDVGMTGQVVLRFAERTFLDQATSGEPCELSFGHAINPSKSLLVTAHAVYLPRTKKPITGPKGVQATFSWQAAKDLDLGRSVTVVLTNDVAAY
jgi:hypothetical protein